MNKVDDLLDDEFEKRLMEILMSHQDDNENDDDDEEDLDNDDDSDNHDELNEENDEDESSNDDNDKEDDDGEDDTDHMFDEFLSGMGEVSQNNDMKVKVQILPPCKTPYKKLENLVGCADIKHRMEDLISLSRYNNMMDELFPGNKKHNVSLHSVFLGNPGTGKTTVCKIFGSLLHQAGVLSIGHVVVCDRSTFLGTLWGDEERALQQVLEKAEGGVLMIDEAYLFDSSNKNDPARMVIQQLMARLADETERDLAVVLCGYKEPMEKLLDSNPGLQSRFPNRFEFPDFTVDELCEITRRRVKEFMYEFTDTAWDKYRQLLANAYSQRDPKTWGNARFIANQLERIYVRHATRCVRHVPTDKQQMLMITPEDIQPLEMSKARRKIGF